MVNKYKGKKLNKSILNQINNIKEQFKKDGFVIVGIFGSYARGEETPDSDIDILYELTPAFIERYDGFEAFARLREIKYSISKTLGKKVDIVAKSGLSRTGKDIILEELEYV